MIRFRSVFALLALVAVVFANGWHLGVAQAYGWMTMASENSQTMELQEAISRAMAGEELCNVCEFVADSAAAQLDEGFGELAGVSLLLLVFFALGGLGLARERVSALPRVGGEIWNELEESVAGPPPRA